MAFIIFLRLRFLNIWYAITEILSQLTSKKGWAGRVTHKTWNYFKSSKIDKWHQVTCFLKKDDSCRDEEF